MDWYKKAHSEEDESIFGAPVHPFITAETMSELDHDLLLERQREILEEERKRHEEHQRQLETELPDEILQEFYPIEAVEPFNTYNRYVWQDREQVETELANGLKMNGGHWKLPEGWYFIHVGDIEWIERLHEDYGREGPVCEIEISELPEGFYYVDDPDIVIKEESPSSGMLISKIPVIPPNCVDIVTVLDTQEYVDENAPLEEEEEEDEGYKL